MTVSFIGGRNRSTRGKPLTCHKSLTNFITQCFIKYTSQWVEFEFKSLMAIGTHYIDACEIETGISLSVKTWCHSSNIITFTNINEHSTMKNNHLLKLVYWYLLLLRKLTALRRKNKDWLARNQNNVSELSDVSIRRLLFHYKNPTQRVGLVQSGPHHHHLIAMI